jgi:uncharacterized membrane protein
MVRGSPIRMTYNPPGGAFGHVIAKLFGADPKTELDEDLMRLKSFLETGIEPTMPLRTAHLHDDVHAPCIHDLQVRA